jgi:hypothetical protein
MQGRGGHVGVHGDAHAHAGVVAAADLVEHDRRVAPVEAGAAPLRIVLQAEHSERAHLLVERLVEVPHLVELARARDELLLHELPHGLPEQAVLGAGVEIVCHGRHLSRGSRAVPPGSARPGAGALCVE